MELKTSARIRIILRGIALVFGAIVLGVIDDKLDVYLDPLLPKVCYFDEDLFNHDSYCKLGIASGALAVGIALVCNALDLAASSSKVVLAVSFVSSTIMFLLWISCFGYLIDGWIDMNNMYDSIPGDVRSSAETVLAFSVFSVPVWIAIAVISYRSYSEVEPEHFWYTCTRDTSKPM